jgi:lipoprotein-anchoring transpeptidase ErfK/SrfK
MRNRSLIAVAVILVVLIGGAGAVYAYDSSRADTIAAGITVGAVDLGGMNSAEAGAALEASVAKPLRRPVKVRYDGRTFRLTARKAKLETDVDAMVEEAIARSREGHVISRTTRDLLGDGVRARIEPRVSYSKSAVNRLVKRVKDDFDRPAREPSVAWSGTGLSIQSGQDGREIGAKRLRRRVGQELTLPGDRTVKARSRVIETKTSRAELRERYPSVITVDRSGYRLRYYRNLEMVKSYPIAVGQAGLETPAGLYSIQNKAVDPAWHVPERKWAGKLAGKTIPGGRADNPLKARWLGIFDGAGIHGTSDVGSLGTNASHGCIRMSIPEVKDLYDRVSVGAPIYIS